MRVDERVYPPLGGGPLLIHEVTIRNTGARARSGSWFEYWDANPYDQAAKRSVGLEAPRYSAATRTLSVSQRAEGDDRRPLSIFAAALSGPVSDFTTDTASFFGAGTRALPAAVAAGRLDRAIAPATPAGSVGRAMMAFRAPWKLRPGHAITLRYAYGIAHPGQIRGPRGTPARTAAVASPGAQRGGPARCPRSGWARGARGSRASFSGPTYTLRSGASYEECRGRRIISQGGYYQYDLGFQGAFRDPLQHMLPMIYSDPGLARDVLLYSASEQPLRGGQIPYAMSSLCRPNDALENANDMDLWLLWSAAEYGLATRDLPVLRHAGALQPTAAPPRCGATSSGRSRTRSRCSGPHGGYLTPGAGDWSDFSTAFLQMTESNLVSAQLAYVYPRLAQLADLRGDRAVRPHAARGRRPQPGGHAPRVDRRRLVLAGLRGRPPDRPRRDLRRAPAVGDPRRGAARRPGPDAGAQRPPLPHRRGRARRGARSRADRLLPVARVQRPGRHGAQLPGGHRHRGQQRGVRGRLVVRRERLAGVVARRARGHGARRPPLRLRRAAAQHPSRPRPRLSAPLGRDDLGGRRLPRALLHRSGALRDRPHRLHGPDHAPARLAPLRHDQARGNRAHHARLPDPAEASAAEVLAPAAASGCGLHPRGARGYVVTLRPARLRMEVTAPDAGPFIAYANGTPVRSRQHGRTVAFTLRARAGRAAQWAISRR